MGVNYATLIYAPAFDMFAGPVTFYPYSSQPGAPAYNGRGIFDTRSLNVVGEDGAVYADQETILDILEAEFAVLPRQNDRVVVEADGDKPAPGEFEIINSATNGGGETTLVLRKWMAPAP
jgi:hypothetical protein